jgi:hypothetical protein
MTNAILINDSDKCFGLTLQDRDSYQCLVTTEPNPDYFCDSCAEDLLQQALAVNIEGVNALLVLTRGDNANVEGKRERKGTIEEA